MVIVLYSVSICLLKSSHLVKDLLNVMSKLQTDRKQKTAVIKNIKEVIAQIDEVIQSLHMQVK